MQKLIWQRRVSLISVAAQNSEWRCFFSTDFSGSNLIFKQIQAQAAVS